MIDRRHPRHGCLAPPEPRPGLIAVAGDLLDLDALSAAVQRHRPARILHTAGLLTPAGVARPNETVRANVSGRPMSSRPRGSRR